MSSRVACRRFITCHNVDPQHNLLTVVSWRQRWLGKSKFRRPIWLAFLVTAVIFRVTPCAEGWVYWSTTTGDWSAPANWGGTEPTSSIDACIYNGGTANVTQLGEVCAYLHLGSSGVGSSGAVQMSDGSLLASQEYVGESGAGVFTQTGGINTVSGNLYLGYNVGGNGTYNLNGGTLVLQSVGTGSGTAAFNFGGGTLKTSSSFSTALPMNLTGTGGNANVDTAGCALTLSGSLSGSGGLNKFGAGSLALSGSNIFTGTTNVNAGVLAISSAAALPGWDVAGKYSVATGAGLTVGDAVSDGNVATMLATGNFSVGSAVGFDVTTTRTFDGSTLSSGVGLAKSGNGTLTLSKALATTTGAVIITAGTLDLGTFSQQTYGNISIQGGTIRNGMLRKSGGNFDAQAGTISAVLANGSNAAGLVKSGIGTLTLSSANTFTGGTAVEDGVLKLIGGNNRLAGTGAITVDGGTLDLGGYSQETSGNVSVQGGIVQNGTLRKSGGNFDVQAGTVSSALVNGASAAGLVKSGSGIATLSGVNTYTGGTNISEGVLSVSSAASLPGWNAAGRWSVAPSATLAIGDAISATDLGTMIGTGNFTPGSIIGFDVATTRSFDGSGLPASLGLMKLGQGTLSLSGIDAYGGGTTVTAGTLDLGGSTQHTSGAVSFQGGTTQHGTISKSGGDYDAQSGTVSAILTGNVGLAKTGAGTLILSGANMYTGPTNLGSGTLRLASTSALPFGTVLNISSGAILDLNGLNYYAPSITGTGTVALGTGTLIFNNTSDTTRDLRITGQGQLVKSGAGTLELTAVNTYSGVTKVVGGTLRLSNANALPGGTGVGAVGSPLQLGCNAGDPSWPNTAGGVLELAVGNFARSLGTGSGQVFFARSTGGGFSAAGADRIVNIGGASAPLTWGSTNFLDFGYPLILGSRSADATVDFQNPMNFGTNPTMGGVFRVDDGTATVDAKLSGVLSGAGLFSKLGTGTLLLTAGNSYTGKTIVNEGTLRIGVAGALPTGSTSLSVGTGATLDLNGFSHSVISLGGSGTIALGGATLTVNPTGYSGMSNTVTGVGGLTKIGDGSFDINSPSNTYTGPTIISGGVLRINYANSLPGGVGPTGGTSNLVLNGGVLALGGSGYSFLRSLGGGPEQVQFTSSGGFSNYFGSGIVNLGGSSTPITWGQDGFVPDGCSLVLSLPASFGMLDFQNPIKLGGQIRTVQVDTGGSASPIVDVVISGALSGKGGLNKTGSGILALTNDCSYSGGTVISAGTLQIGNGGSTGSLSGSVVNQATLVFKHSDTYTFSGSISGPGAVKVLGTGPLVLAAANTYTGATIVSGSLLRLADPQAIPGGIGATGGISNLIVGGPIELGTNPAGIVELAAGDFSRGLGAGLDQVQFGTYGGFSAFGAPRAVNFGGASATIVWGSSFFSPDALRLSSTEATHTIDFQNPISLGGTRIVQVDNGSANIDAKLSGALSSGGLTKTGAGVLELSAANTYTGTTTVSQGVLRLNNAMALPGGTGATGGTSNLMLAGTVVDLACGDFFRSVGTGPDQVQFSSSFPSRGGGFSASGGTRIVNFGGNSATFSISNSYPLIFGSSVADSTVEFQNPVRLSDASYGNTTIQVNDGPVPVEARLVGVITSAGAGLIKTGTGTLDLAAVNTFIGALSIESGAVRLSDPFALPGGVGAVGGTSNLTLNGGVVELAAGDFLRGLGTGPDQVQFSYYRGGGFSAVGADRVVNLGGNLTPMTWGASAFVPAGQPLILGSSSADATLDFQNPIDLGGLVRTVSCENGSGAVDGKLSGVLSGVGGGLTKTGAGTLALTAENSYTGATTVDAGTLIVANGAGSATGSGAVTVNTGATLSGSGIISGPVTIAGTLSPGNSPGILTINNQVTFHAASLFNVEINGPTAGSDYDQLITTGPLSLAGSLAATFGTFTPTAHDMLFVINNTGSGVTTGRFQFADDALIGRFNGCDWYITYDANNAAIPSLNGGNDVAIYSVAVPEPSVLTVLLTALAAFVCWKQMRRRR
jgi:fibronectin-binding autotransporter adhesin